MYKCGIYKITNTRNGKFYIGSTKNFSDRKSDHLTQLRGNRKKNPVFQNAWNAEKDKSVFIFELIIVCSEKHLIFYEQLCIDNLTPMYNCAKIAGRPDLANYWKNKTKEQKRNQIAAARKALEEIPPVELRRRRSRNGAKHHATNLSEAQAIEILTSSKSCSELCKEFKVSDKVIYGIKERYTWKHLAEPAQPLISGHRGENNSKAKLSESQAAEIRSAKGTHKELAAKYGVSSYTISDIKNQKTWGHLTTPIIR